MNVVQELFSLGGIPSRDFRIVPDECILTARRVVPLDSSRYAASSAYEAACWLLALRYCHCADRSDLTMPLSIDPRELLGFRGQHARYDTLLPSICRLSKLDRQPAQHACLWLRAALQSFHDRCYRYCKPRYEPGQYWFGIDETSCVAEHYGIPTNLMNWSWDPLVALVFALKGLREEESGIVLVRPIDPSRDAEFILAPPIAKRVWLQRGFFQELACPDEESVSGLLMPLLVRSSPARFVSQLVQIRFPCTKADIEWAKATFDKLLLPDDPILLLVAWSIKLAASGPPRSAVLHHAGDWEYLSRELNERGLCAPPFGDAVQEDVNLTADYIDAVALRARSSGVLGYDTRALSYLARRLPADATIRNSEYAEAAHSRRLKRLARLLAEGAGYLEAIATQVPFMPIEDGEPDQP